jgi:hypothetical protein
MKLLNIAATAAIYFGLIAVSYGKHYAGFTKDEEPVKSVYYADVRKLSGNKDTQIASERKKRWEGLDQKYQTDNKAYGDSYMKLKYASIR